MIPQAPPGVNLETLSGPMLTQLITSSTGPKQHHTQSTGHQEESQDSEYPPWEAKKTKIK